MRPEYIFIALVSASVGAAIGVFVMGAINLSAAAKNKRKEK